MPLMRTDREFEIYHPQYSENIADYALLDDVLAGEQRIKANNTKYLPMPDYAEGSGDQAEVAAAEARYQQYKQRALFSNITRRMARTLIGLGFLREPTVELPEKLKMLEDNVNGSGLSLIQFAKELALQTISYGRAGVLVDYPSTAAMRKMRSKRDRERIRPYLDYYMAKEIINWMDEGYRLQFVTLRREIEHLESYQVSMVATYRILEMVGGVNYNYSMGGVYQSKMYYATETDMTVTRPVDSNKMQFDHIPFYICGAFSNKWDVDRSPLYDVASLNLGHYRNSADAEEISFVGGQPMLFISGLDNPVVAETSQQAIRVGSRRGISLGPGGRPYMLQADPNSAPRELMKDKEELMEKLGVQLAVGSSQVQTATEVVTESLIRNSVLTSVLQNVSEVINSALRDACLYVGADPDSVNFEIDTSIEMEEAEGVAQTVSDSVASSSQPQQQQQQQQPPQQQQPTSMNNN